jgi:hypothetical protein
VFGSEAVDVRHREVHDDHGGKVFERDIDRLGAVASGKDGEATGSEVLGVQFACVGDVVGDQDRRVRLRALQVNAVKASSVPRLTRYDRLQARGASRVWTVRQAGAFHHDGPGNFWLR